jgi:acyl carrier protein
MQTIVSIKKFIATELLSSADPASIGDQDPLIESGIIDSFGIMSLISFMEKEFGVRLSSNELMPENFVNITAIANLIESKLGGGSDGK